MELDWPHLKEAMWTSRDNISVTADCFFSPSSGCNVVNKLSHSLYPRVWNIEKCEIKTISSAEHLGCNTTHRNSEYQHFRATYCHHLQCWSERSKDAIWIYRHLAEKVVCPIYDRSGREYLSLCGPMEMGKWPLSELLWMWKWKAWKQHPFAEPSGQTGVREGTFTVLNRVTTEGREGTVKENNFLPGTEDRKMGTEKKFIWISQFNIIIYDSWSPQLHTS